MLLRVTALFVTAICAAAAHAGDGVIEINQAKVLAGGVSSCDSLGFPATICDSGSYRLTSNLTYTVGTIAIEIEVADVNLDLNGMTVRGVNSCTTGPGGWVVSCAFLPSAPGALILGSAVRTTVSHGRVIGSRNAGISLREDSEIRDVQVSESGDSGAYLGDGSYASNVSAIGNLAFGIHCASACSLSNIEAARNSIGVLVGIDSRVAGAVVRLNRGGLIAGGPRVRVSDIVANANGGDGVALGENSSAKGVVASGNGTPGFVGSTGFRLGRFGSASDIVANGNIGTGVTVGNGSSATGVTAAQNTSHGIELGIGAALSNFTAFENGASGVRALDGSFVSDGALRENGGASTAYGLQVQGGAGYRALVITKLGGGTGATVSPGGVNLGNNTCQGGACP